MPECHWRRGDVTSDKRESGIIQSLVTSSRSWQTPLPWLVSHWEPYNREWPCLGPSSRLHRFTETESGSQFASTQRQGGENPIRQHQSRQFM